VLPVAWLSVFSVQVVGITKDYGKPQTNQQQKLTVLAADGYEVAFAVNSPRKAGCPLERQRIYGHMCHPEYYSAFHDISVSRECAKHMVSEASDVAKWLQDHCDVGLALEDFVLSKDHPVIREWMSQEKQKYLDTKPGRMAKQQQQLILWAGKEPKKKGEAKKRREAAKAAAGGAVVIHLDDSDWDGRPPVWWSEHRTHWEELPHKPQWSPPRVGQEPPLYQDNYIFGNLDGRYQDIVLYADEKQLLDNMFTQEETIELFAS